MYVSSMTQVGVVLARVVAEDVLSELGDDGDVAAELGGHDSLVGALAAEAHLEAGAGDGFAQLGQAGRIADEVDVGCADDADFGSLHGWMALRLDFEPMGWRIGD